MRKLLTMLLPLLVFAACNKEMPGQTGNDVNIGQEEHTVTLRIGSSSHSTKAHNSGDYPLSDGLKRLDVYLYHYNTNQDEDRHIVLTPDASGETLLELREKKEQRMSVMVIGNLDPDTATYLEGKTMSDLSIYGRIFISAGNFAPDAIPMIASMYLTFNEDRTIDMPLMRIMCRIDVDKLKVDFADESLRGKEVWLRNIVVGNATNCFFILPTAGFSSGSVYATQFGLDNYELAENAFGGIQTGFRYRTNASSPSVTNYGYYSGVGKMNGTFYNAMNVCYKASKGVLNVDAPSPMYEATIQNYDKSTGAGKVVSAGDMTTPHTFNVGKSFYTIYNSLVNPGPIVSDFSDQLATQKLIFELEIDGKTWFYPIELTDTQPNTVYQIDNITIKSLGSAYSNFYEKKYAADMSISVKGWDEVPIANWNLGVDPYTGEPAAQD